MYLSHQSRLGQLRINPGSTLFLFICWWLLAWIFGAVVITKVGSSTLPLLRWAILLQDVIIFIMPVIMTLILCAKRPISFAKLDKSPTLSNSALVILAIITAIPAMNVIIKWNESAHLPESMVALETFLRNAEANAEATMSMLLGDTTLTGMLISLLLVGVLTGISEEIFFRGGLQNILIALFRNHHLAIWTTAFVFSAIHMQFFGFFPRLLMGVFFGYLVWWTSSLWTSVIAHAVNNCIVVISLWAVKTGKITTDINNIGTGESAMAISFSVISLLITATIILLIRRNNITHIRPKQ